MASVLVLVFSFLKFDFIKASMVLSLNATFSTSAGVDRDLGGCFEVLGPFISIGFAFPTVRGSKFFVKKPGKEKINSSNQFSESLWEYKNFSVTLILREIKINDFIRSSKNDFVTNSKALNFHFGVLFVIF